MPLLPLGAELAQSQSEALGGEIGFAGLFEDKKASQSHDELEALGTGHRIPADGFVAIFEMPCAGTPDEHCGEFPIFLANQLAKPVAGLRSFAELVLADQSFAGLIPLGFGLGDFDFQFPGMIGQVFNLLRPLELPDFIPPTGRF